MLEQPKTYQSDACSVSSGVLQFQMHLFCIVQLPWRKKKTQSKPSRLFIKEWRWIRFLAIKNRIQSVHGWKDENKSAQRKCEHTSLMWTSSGRSWKSLCRKREHRLSCNEALLAPCAVRCARSCATAQLTSMPRKDWASHVFENTCGIRFKKSWKWMHTNVYSCILLS